MDYTAKLLKALFEIIDLLKDIKKQNAMILKEIRNNEVELKTEEIIIPFMEIDNE